MNSTVAKITYVKLPFPFIADDNGWEVCREHLGFTEKCNTRNTEEKQLRSQFWGIIQKCVHYGTSQAWWTSVYWPEGSCDTAFRVKGEEILIVYSHDVI